MSIGLRVGGRGIVVLDLQLLTEISERIIIKLLSIIKGKDSKDAEVANNVFPDKASDILLYDSGPRFYLNLFGEVVNFLNEELELPHLQGEGSHYVKPPLSEWPRSSHWGKFF